MCVLQRATMLQLLAAILVLESICLAGDETPFPETPPGRLYGRGVL